MDTKEKGQKTLKEYCTPRQAAEILGMTKKAVLSRCRRNSNWLAPQHRGAILQGCSIGELLFLERSAVEAEARRRGILSQSEEDADTAKD